MAQLNYEDFVKMTQSRTNGSSNSKNQDRPFVGFFGLNDDGDTALVRFNIANINDVKVYSIHQVTAGGKRRKVSCLRTSYDTPVDACPLCRDVGRPSFKTFIELLRYDTTDKGVEITPCVWEQPAKMRETLKSFTVDYGDLRDYLFKIVRHGKHGDTGTTYTIIPANMKMYSSDNYKPAFDLFGDFKPSNIILEKTAEEMEEFLEVGNFPNPFEKQEKGGKPTESTETLKTSDEPGEQSVQHRQYEYQDTTTSESKEPVVGDTCVAPHKPRRYTY